MPAALRQAGGRWLQGLERDTLDLMSHQGEGGPINLAAVPTFATRWLLPRLPQLAHPDITVHIDVQTRPFLFADTGFDAALYAGTPEQVARWPGVQAQWLMDEETVPVCSPQLLATAQQRDLGRAWLPVGPEVIAACRCCSKARGPRAGASGSTRCMSMRRARWTACGWSCSPCWPWPPARAWAWR
jgi:DNA-binding transcriptional LysR family regulator